jgi:hypothetical protein
LLGKIKINLGSMLFIINESALKVHNPKGWLAIPD